MSEIKRHETVYGAPDYDGDYVRHDDHIAALEAVKATVRPLEWVMMYDGSTYHASSILGRWARWDGHYLPPAGYGSIRCEDPVAAAQADYETRILSALVPSPALEANRELIASFMIRNSFATGHGDTVEDLLSEFQWQLDERRQVVETLRDENERLTAFARSFELSCVEDSFYKDCYLHISEPEKASFRLGNGSQFSKFISGMEERRRAALSDKGDAS